jgi:hypothetical protein
MFINGFSGQRNRMLAMVRGLGESSVALAVKAWRNKHVVTLHENAKKRYSPPKHGAQANSVYFAVKDGKKVSHRQGRFS